MKVRLLGVSVTGATPRRRIGPNRDRNRGVKRTPTIAVLHCMEAAERRAMRQQGSSLFSPVWVFCLAASLCAQSAGQAAVAGEAERSEGRRGGKKRRFPWPPDYL